MSNFGYRTFQLLGRGIAVQTLRVRTLRPEQLDRPGPFLLACTHHSHLEPFLFSIVMQRKIDWMARIEMFPRGPGAWFMNACDAFAVRRFGVPVSAIRAALARLKAGRVVGIFPEGGVAQGKDSMMRGGDFKKGVCLLAYRSRLPVLPCIMLGTHDLNRVPPWLPFKRAKIWIGFGEHLIMPPTHVCDRRAARTQMAQELSQAFMSLYQEMLDTFELDDARIP